MSESSYSDLFAPWRAYYGQVPAHLDYFEGTMWEGVLRAAEAYPSYIAFDFMGKHTTYESFVRKVNRCARALFALGIRPGDRVTVCLPNCPQAVVLFYAINLVGGISNMVHPLSGEKEIEFYLNEAESRFAVTLDSFYEKFLAVRKDTPLETLVVASVADEMPIGIKLGYRWTEGRHLPKVKKTESVLLWGDFLKNGESFVGDCVHFGASRDPAVILYSGGTTGVTKGILLSNQNFNALAQQVVATNPMFAPGDRMLAVMPIFHGFGLGVCIHSMLFHGGRCLLVPRFTVQSYAKLLKTSHCNFIAGVPSLYEALLREPSVNGADLSSLKGVFSGGDSLSVGLKARIDRFLEEHKASVCVREGYGTTECVTASCLTPYHTHREGSIGIPFPDMYYKIVCSETLEQVPPGEEGEICLCGPTVMIKYLNHPEETEQTLRRHRDGRTWLHTGDLGMMDEDGFVYFRQRIKRMIVTNGYNVYPSQIENVLDSSPWVQISCVIGIPDPLRMQAVKAFVVLRPGVEPSERTREKILDYCGKYVAGYALPRQIEFRDSLPKTLVGKVAYRVLEEEISAASASED